MVELPIVGRAVQYPMLFRPKCRRAPAIEVQGILSAQYADKVRQFGDANSFGMAGRTSIYGDENDPFVLGDEEGTSRMFGSDEGAVAILPHAGFAVFHQQWAGREDSTFALLIFSFDGWSPRKDAELSFVGMNGAGYSHLEFIGRCRVDHFLPDAEIANGVSLLHVVKRPVDSCYGLVLLGDEACFLHLVGSRNPVMKLALGRNFNKVYVLVSLVQGGKRSSLVDDSFGRNGGLPNGRHNVNGVRLRLSPKGDREDRYEYYKG